MGRQKGSETKPIRIRVDLWKFIKSKAKYGETLSEVIERLISKHKNRKQETEETNGTTQAVQPNN
jgi:predicted CopG family antitoxin